MSETLFFDRRCHFSPVQQAAYRVEIDAELHARFFKLAEPAFVFHEEIVFRPAHKIQLIRYLSLVLKSLTNYLD